MAAISNETKRELAIGIHAAGLVNFGEFTFKSGVESPMYMNLRNFGSHPKLLKKVASVFAELMADLSYDLVAGIPYGAVPIMMAVSLDSETPVIFPRKESKEYGMGKDLIGDFTAGQSVVVVDDLVTDGASKVESMVPFDAAGLKVQDFVVLLDYDRGASEKLQGQGYNLHSAMTVREVVEILGAEKLIDEAMLERCQAFLS